MLRRRRRQRAYPLVQVHDAGLLSGVVPEAPGDYRLAGALRRRASDTVDDPYRFLPTLGELDLHLIGEGRHERLWDVLGAHVAHATTPRRAPVTGTSFAVWAPNAQGVQRHRRLQRLGRQRRTRCASLGSSGVWELFVPGVGVGHPLQVPDPRRRRRVARQGRPAGVRHRGAAADGVGRDRDATYAWSDADWMARRAPAHPHARADERLRGAPRLVAAGPGLPRAGRRSSPTTSARPGFTHVELLPVAEHPFGGSWGYQVTSYYAPTARFGTPDDFRYLVDRLHQAGIGVIVDWVPAHFPKDDWALAPLRRHPALRARRPAPRRAPRLGHATSSTSAATRCATSWSPTRCTGSRSSTSTGCGSTPSPRCSTSTTPATEGEWTPNVYGGRENLEAVAFLQEMNATVYKHHPGVVTIAEESTAWPGVTRPTHLGGLGFGVQVEHGLDARHARLRRQGPDPPQLPPQPADVLDGVRLQRELRAADQPRRGRARQGLAVAQDARRPRGKAAGAARAAGLHVGAPGQAAAVHGRRVRPGARSGPRSAALDWYLLDEPAAPAASSGWSATSTAVYQAQPGALDAATPRPRASPGSTPTTRPATC